MITRRYGSSPSERVAMPSTRRQRVVDDLAIGRRHRLQHASDTGGLHFLGHLVGKRAQCNTATLAVAADVHAQTRVVIAEPALRGHPGQILDCLQRGAAGTDQQTELLAVHPNLQVVTVFDQLGGTGRGRRPTPVRS